MSVNWGGGSQPQSVIFVWKVGVKDAECSETWNKQFFLMTPLPYPLKNTFFLNVRKTGREGGGQAVYGHVR